MPSLEDSTSSEPPARSPKYSLVDFATDEELKQHLAPEDLRFTSRRLTADLEHLFGHGSDHVARDWTVLELGSALGHTTAVLSKLFRRVIAVDYLPGAGMSRSETVGDLGNVFWLTVDLYRDPWLSFIEGNRIDVAFVDAMHTEEAVAADLRACTELPGLRFVLVHDYNFVSVRRAIRDSARHFALLAPLGEARRRPLEERPQGSGALYGPKFPEGALLQPLASATNASDASWRRVAMAAAKLSKDPELAALVAEAEAADRQVGGGALVDAESEPHFRELCGASFTLAGETEDLIGPDAVHVRLHCHRRSRGRRGMAFFDEAGATSRAEWRARKDDVRGEGWIQLRYPTRRGGNRSFALLPATNRRSFLWAPIGGLRGRPQIAVEDSKIVRDVRLAIGRRPLQASGPWGAAVGLERGWAVL